MFACSVFGCTNSTDSSVDSTIQYHPFPKDPLILQQWVDACWNNDPIDVETARICSIHFDNDSYTSDYKMLEFSGIYSKTLKCDVLPTLYLPNSNFHPHNTPSSTITMASPEYSPPEIIVYEVQSVAIASDSSNFLGCCSTEPAQIVHIDDAIVFSKQESQSDNRYHQITTDAQLKIIQQENQQLEQTVNSLSKEVAQLEKQIQDKKEKNKTCSDNLRQLENKYNSWKKRSLSVNDQKNLLSKIFSESQLKILMGRKKIYWSNDDMAMGYTIRHLSNKECYLYLTKNMNIPLPALSSIKRWATLKKNELNTTPNAKYEESEELST